MTAWSDYLKSIEAEIKVGNSTEHTHRPALKTLIESIVDGAVATNEPRRVECGAPDFIITRSQTPLGYIETKDIGKNLDVEERSEQMKRYLDGLSNLILTDYLEFRWYADGKFRATAKLARLDANGKLIRERNSAAEVEELLNGFLQAQYPTVGSPKELAARMAALAKQIRLSTLLAVQGEDLTDDRPDPLHDQMDAFRKVLLHDLTEDQFADMYAQTICYGLFAARCNAPDGVRFTREQAAYQLPRTNPFLRQMFGHIAGPELSENIAWAVDDLAELLNRADIESILKDFGARTRQEDPVVHFYETFLAHYDPKMREARGVYYTPEPVVSYIVRSVDHILKTDFGLRRGLADETKIKLKNKADKSNDEVHKVQILDPATGTGTFLHGVIDHIHESFRGNEGMWSGYVRDHLLPRLFGFELMMAPYAVAHMKLGLQLEELGYNFESDERLRIYLTNTLEEAEEFSGTLFATWLSQEANAAGKVKKDRPVMVVLGNPPYSGHSANKGQWINDLLRGKDSYTGNVTENYFQMDGKPLGERNPKMLNDDYVKFIRFAQWRIEQTGYGILAFITNHGYLDNPTFRGMRESLMNTFDDLYVLDLHGNSKKKERAPDGGKDENVFDIQQGVSIGIFVKKSNGDKKSCTVRHANLYGIRDKKYEWLWEHDVSDTGWKTCQPKSAHYLFQGYSLKLETEYGCGTLMSNVFTYVGQGFTSHRDNFAVAYEKQDICTRLSNLRDDSIDDGHFRALYNIPDTTTWKLAEARRKIHDDRNAENYIYECLYRPFDTRFCLLHHEVMDRPRIQSQRHMWQANIALLSSRGYEIHGGFDHVLCTTMVSDRHAVSIKEINYLFPIYIYPSDNAKINLFDEDEPTDAPGGRRPNLSPEFIADFSKKLGMEFVQDGKGDRTRTFGPEDVFSYMYAVFHSPTYRERYAEFLKIEFPRLPLTSNADLFRRLCALGDELVGLHLMEETGPALTKYPVAGDSLVEKVRYTAPGEGADEGRVWINATQYFEGVPPEVWEFHIGGYQVCDKWLKDRKGRKLTYADLTHYQNVVSALAETIRLMAEIDETIDDHGGFPIE